LQQGFHQSDAVHSEAKFCFAEPEDAMFATSAAGHATNVWKLSSCAAVMGLPTVAMNENILPGIFESSRASDGK
jgi:hypothetical protein